MADLLKLCGNGRLCQTLTAGETSGKRRASGIALSARSRRTAVQPSGYPPNSLSSGLGLRFHGEQFDHSAAGPRKLLTHCRVFKLSKYGLSQFFSGLKGLLSLLRTILTSVQK